MPSRCIAKVIHDFSAARGASNKATQPSTDLVWQGRKDPRVLHALSHVVADTKWDSSTVRSAHLTRSSSCTGHLLHAVAHVERQVLSLIKDQKQPESLLMQRNWNGPRTQNYIEPMCAQTVSVSDTNKWGGAGVSCCILGFRVTVLRHCAELGAHQDDDSLFDIQVIG